MIRQFIKAWERVKEVHSSGGKIFIRGAGNNGRMLLSDISALGVKVSAFIDCNPTLVGGEVKGVPVISSDGAYTLVTGTYFILCSVGSGDAYAELRDEMEDHGLIEGDDFSDFGLNCESRMYSDGVDFRDVTPYSYDRRELNARRWKNTKAELSYQLDRPCESDINAYDEYNFIAGIDFTVTTYCSLRCAYCWHLFPMIKQPRHFEPAAIVGDLDKLLSVSKVGGLYIMGGEAFLHPELPDILSRLRSMEHLENISFVRIFANGATMPGEGVLEQFARFDNASVYISNYGAHSRKLKELVEMLEHHGIPTFCPSYASKWRDLGAPERNRRYSADDLRHLFACCEYSVCYKVFDGQFHTCSRGPVLYETGFLTPRSEDFVDIRGTSADDLREVLHRYLYDTPYVEACNYCDGGYPGAKEVPRGAHVKEDQKRCQTA